MSCLPTKFKCEKLHTIKNIFAKGFFVFSFDLKSGYHHIDIFPDHRKYLTFSWEFVPGHTRFFHLLFCLLSFPVLLIFLPSCLASGDTLEAQGLPVAIFFL